MPKWTIDNISDQSGRVAIVTGGNSGLGYNSVMALAKKGAQVVLAARDIKKSQEALQNLKKQVPQGKIEFIRLDLSSLESVRTFVADFKSRYSRLDILMNNAGVMAIPRRETAEGFEMQLGVNHLGHFALTGLLLDLLVATPGSRVINTSSMAQSMGKLDFNDLQMRQNYTPYGAYGRSKLANMLFTSELQRRLAKAGVKVQAMAAHPGYAATNLQSTSATASGSKLTVAMYAVSNRIFAQSSLMGTLPQLYAATAPEAKGGLYYGPRYTARGYPIVAKGTPRAYDEQAARKLWEVSEELTGVRYNFEKVAVSASV